LENKGKNLELIQEAGTWKVGVGGGKYVPAQKSAVKSMISSLLQVKPSRLVAKNPEKWSEYQVDTSGIRVTTYESGDKTLDLIVGRFGMKNQNGAPQNYMQNQNSFYTFVRLSEDEEVYAADNFMAMSLQTDPAAYRNKQLISALTDSIAEIQFNYPDSTFKMIKNGSIWFVAGQQIDSASAAGYLNNLRYVSSSGFVDDVPEAALTAPAFNLTIVQKGQEENIIVNAYQHPEYKWILSSTKNPHSYFADEAVFNKIFKRKNYFLNNK
jgi:hypothetical protein